MFGAVQMFMRVMSQSYNALRIILFFLLLSMILFGYDSLDFNFIFHPPTRHLTHVVGICR